MWDTLHPSPQRCFCFCAFCLAFIPLLAILQMPSSPAKGGDREEMGEGACGWSGVTCLVQLRVILPPALQEFAV